VVEAAAGAAACLSMVINPVLALQALVLFVAGGWFSALLGVAVVKVCQPCWYPSLCVRVHAHMCAVVMVVEMWRVFVCV
jgi:hypothetical protein